MRLLLIITLFLLVGAAAVAEQKTPERKGNKQVVITEDTLKKQASPQTNRDKQQPTWPRPYQPSIEISADTTVPFPTDI
jgi:hypothetical protein